jgi:hypothetical protein
MTHTIAWRNPSDDYPPTRPGLGTLLIALGLIVVGAAIVFWPVISLHLPTGGL